MADEDKDTQVEFSAQQQMQQVDKWLEDFESKLGLPKYSESLVSADISKYLGMKYDQLEKLTPDHCAEIAAFLSIQAFHIQRAYNRELSHVTWAESVLRLGVAGKSENYRGSFSQQDDQAIKNDDYLLKVSRIKTFAKQRVDRLSFLATTIQKLADKLENLQIAKGKKL
jgi:hypothetical protein